MLRVRSSSPDARPRRCRARAAALFVALACGCATAGPFVVDLRQHGSPFPDRLDRISTYPAAAAAIADAFDRRLRFPLFPVSFVFYPGEREFEAALVAAGHDPSSARSTAATMTGIGGYRRVLLNERALEDDPWIARVAVLAHEATHSLQYELGGGLRGLSDQWLREGFAEWVSINVLEHLRAMTYAEYKRLHVTQWRGSTRSRAPRLDEMATFPQWVVLGARTDIAPYSQAFLAVDLLIDRHGIDAVIRYFAAFSKAQDRLGNFRAAFDQDLPAFEADLQTHLRNLEPEP